MINLFSTSPRILWPILSSFIPTLGEGNGTPLQYSCLENPMDGGAWKAVVRGVATEWLYFYFSRSCIGEGNGNPLQCSCLENPRDRGASWAAVYGVAQSRTRLKWLSSSSIPTLWFQNYHLFIPSCIPSYSIVIPRWHSFPCIYSDPWTIKISISLCHNLSIQAERNSEVY